MDALRVGLEIALATISVVGVLGVLFFRMQGGKGIGIRLIQLIVILLVVPMLGILALENAAVPAVMTLLGALLGYVLSGVGSDGPVMPNRVRRAALL